MGDLGSDVDQKPQTETSPDQTTLNDKSTNITLVSPSVGQETPTLDESVTFVTQSPLQKEANEAVARLDELMAGGPPDARHPPTEEDITDARNEAENAIAAAVATGGYNPYTIQEIKMVTKNEGVSQGIQQVGGGVRNPTGRRRSGSRNPAGRKGVVQEIQQVGGGVSQGISRNPTGRRRKSSQGIQQVGGVSQGTQEIPRKKKPKTQNQQAGMAQGYL